MLHGIVQLPLVPELCPRVNSSIVPFRNNSFGTVFDRAAYDGCLISASAMGAGAIRSTHFIDRYQGAHHPAAKTKLPPEDINPLISLITAEQLDRADRKLPRPSSVVRDIVQRWGEEILWLCVSIAGDVLSF